MSVKTILEYKKSTKGTHIYANDSIDAPITSLYIKRDSVPASPPKTLTLEITFS